MTLGIIILCAAILLIFFGLLEKFFRSLRVANWLAFLLVLSLVIGAIVPNITIGEHFSMNVSGFLIPTAIMLLFMVLMGASSELIRAIFAVLSVAAVTVVVNILMPTGTSAMVITTTLIVGFLSGAVAYLTGQSRMAIIAGTMGGIVLGDVAVNLISKYAYGARSISLGTGGIFNSIIIALVFGLILFEAVTAMIRAMSRKRLSGTALNFEAGEDISPDKNASTQYDKTDKKRHHDIDDVTMLNDISAQMNQTFGDYGDYFDDKLL